MSALWCWLFGHRWESITCWWNDDEQAAGLPPHVERICLRCRLLDDGLDEEARRLTDDPS